MTTTSQRTSTLVLVRHAESDWNAQRVVQGQNDTSRLTERGREQARHVCDVLRKREFDVLVSSDLERARATSVLIGEALQLPLQLDPLLRERCFGSLEGAPVGTMNPTETGIGGGFVTDPDARPPGGESFRDVVRRAERFVEKVHHQWSTKRILVVTHGVMIRALHAHCSGAPLENLRWETVTNTSVWTVDA